MNKTKLYEELAEDYLLPAPLKTFKNRKLSTELIRDIIHDYELKSQELRFRKNPL